ncbi:hypothetical protein LKO27_11715 [Tessaracoccus sp. OS52]|uniref:hypothetical protein n=1 Tax=Tessaracoccus sp. OS52 TaxID=2886691 RepID=UPI001D12A5FB|nr:hypothetical protein [Tessaracoccus sp. OS52]MCC2594073.1 hypothetical protein [Tessaracoccus sp. OS52]
MSNNQWNNGQADGQWQPQGNPDPNAPEQPQPSANDWNAGQAQADWNSGGQGGSQDWNQPAASQQDWNAQQAPAGQDWNQQPAQDWTQQQQPQQQGWNAQQAGADWNTGAQHQGGSDWNAQPQSSAQEWHQQQPAQDWNAQPQTDWTAQQPAQEWGAPPQGGQPWNQPQGGFQGPPAFGKPARDQRVPSPRRRSDTGLGNVFDFSFKKFALPSAAGTIFLISVICFGIWWVFDLIQVLTVGTEFYEPSGALIADVIFGGLARMFIGVLLTRVLIEGASAVVKLANKADAEKVDEVEKA